MRKPSLVKLQIKFNILDMKVNNENFFLGNHDHSFKRRMFKKEGRLAGFEPIDIYSIGEHGSKRIKRFGNNNKIFQIS
jgi:hypothetical protein